MIDKEEVLRIAKSKSEPLVYHDFDKLKPPNKSGNNWLKTVKMILKDNGYICHER